MLRASRVGMQSLKSRTHLMPILLTCAASVLTGCAGEAEEDIGHVGSALDPTPPPAPPKTALYFIDGSTQDIYSDTNIGQLFRQASADTSFTYHPFEYYPGGFLQSTGKAANVVKTQYYDGPSIACFNQFHNDCWDTTLKLAGEICQGLRSGEIKKFAVFGYSRGTFMVNQAIASARSSCSDMFVDNPVLFEGFIDAVNTTIWNMSSEIAPGIRWHHLHRYLVYNSPLGMFNVAYFSGSPNGSNETFWANTQADHGSMGSDYRVFDNMLESANKDKLLIPTGRPAPYPRPPSTRPPHEPRGDR
jgi:hypothetical protein